MWPGLKEAKAWLKEKKDTFTTAIKVLEFASRFITPDERMRNEAALYGMAKGALSVAEDTVSVINTGVNVSAVGLALVGGSDEDVVKVLDMVGDELTETADNVASGVTGGLAIVNNVIQNPLGTVSTINAQALQFQAELEAGDLGAIAKAYEITTSLALDAAMGAVGELASGARAADTAYELSRVVRRSTPRSNGFSLSRFLNTEISVQWHRGGVIADTMGNGHRTFPNVSFSMGSGESRMLAKVRKITQKFKLLECAECADAIRKSLVKQGIGGEEIILEFKGGRGFIVSDTLGGSTAISTNGIHRGILVDGMVFDNIHKAGIPLDAWIADFFATAERTVTRIPF